MSTVRRRRLRRLVVLRGSLALVPVLLLLLHLPGGRGRDADLVGSAPVRRGQLVLHVLAVGAVPRRGSRAAVGPRQPILLGGVTPPGAGAHLAHGSVGEEDELGRTLELAAVALVPGRPGPAAFHG